MRRYIKLIVIISTFAFISCEKDGEVLVQGVAVDLGLSVKWANCNVGASTPEEYGDYFAWGEVHPKKEYSYNTYTYGLDPKTLPPHADAATVNWGGAWRMPTDAEWAELINNCTCTWTTQNGVYGKNVTSKINGNSIFLPATGCSYFSSLSSAGSYGYYWSSSLNADSPDDAWIVGFFNSEYVYRSYNNRYYGHSVRPVLGESVVETTIPTQITETTAVVGGNVTSDGGATVTERGVVYGTNQNPTTSNTKITAGSGTGSFTCNLTSLQENTTYYIRAYATNDVGTAYGEEVSFTTNGTENGYAYVDLGLSVKWATCNVGASKPEDYGDYFAWGETRTKDTYNWSTYKWCNGSYPTLTSSSILTKYCNNSSYGNNGFTDNKTQLELSDDAARANWGGDWRMPTDAELTELLEQCTWTWTSQNGVNGYKVKSKSNGNSIFLPAAGSREDSSFHNAGSYGYYWSISLNTDYPDYAWGVYFFSGYVGRFFNHRCLGLSVRPVCP